MTKAITLPTKVHKLAKILAAEREKTIIKYVCDLIEKDEEERNTDDKKLRDSEKRNK